MYNNELKQEFINEYLSKREIAPTAVENVFDTSEKLENFNGKDICNFTKSEIEEYYKSINAKSKERIDVSNSVLKEYKIWCINKGVCSDTTMYFDEFIIDDFKRFINKNVLENKYIGEDTLNNYLKELYNPQDQLLLVLLYNGIRGKQLCEIINLNINQIDGNTLHLCTGRDVTVSDNVINLIRETNNTYVYYSMGDNPKKWILTGDNVLKNTKGVRTESMTSIYHRFTMKMITFQKMFDNHELSINRIYISGMLNAIIKGAKEHNMTFKDYSVSDSVKPILVKYEFNRHPTKIAKLFDEFVDYIK